MDTTKAYRPGNGTEGMRFEARFCDRCTHDADPLVCPIRQKAINYSIDDPEYPKEWIKDKGFWPGNPRCTAFVEHCPCIQEVFETGGHWAGVHLHEDCQLKERQWFDELKKNGQAELPFQET
jgi:hypothetical protein